MAKTATLIISNWRSKCGACGQPTLSRARTHDTIIGYGSTSRKGCGAVFTAVTSDQLGDQSAMLAAERPDLPIIDYDDYRDPPALAE